MRIRVLTDKQANQKFTLKRPFAPPQHVLPPAVYLKILFIHKSFVFINSLKLNKKFFFTFLINKIFKNQDKTLTAGGSAVDPLRKAREKIFPAHFNGGTLTNCTSRSSDAVKGCSGSSSCSSTAAFSSAIPIPCSLMKQKKKKPCESKHKEDFVKCTNQSAWVETVASRMAQNAHDKKNPQEKFVPSDSPWERLCSNSRTLLCPEKKPKTFYFFIFFRRFLTRRSSNSVTFWSVLILKHSNQGSLAC